MYQLKFVELNTSLNRLSSSKFAFLAKYTYTTGNCVEYGGYIRKDSDVASDDFFYSIAQRCLFDSRCRAFKFIFELGDYILCNKYIPRPSDSIWEAHQEVSIIFLLDSGRGYQSKLYTYWKLNKN